MQRLILGLALATATALAPCLAAGDDQAIAAHIMQRLKAEQQRGALQDYHLDMQVENGTVWYEGHVATEAQKDLVLRTAQMAHHLGVVQVVDAITVRSQDVRPAMMQTADARANDVRPANHGMPAREPVLGAPAVASHPMNSFQGHEQQASWRQEPTNGMPPSPHAISPGPYSMAPVPMAVGQPMPMGAAGGVCPPGVMPGPAMGPMVGVHTDNPMMPGYAWPAYAAYPNYAAVTYPRQYSPTAWPYIGPFYPYPQVPLGWRKVTLEWDDGWWFLDFHNR